MNTPGSFQENTRWLSKSCMLIGSLEQAYGVVAALEYVGWTFVRPSLVMFGDWLRVYSTLLAANTKPLLRV